MELIRSLYENVVDRRLDSGLLAIVRKRNVLAGSDPAQARQRIHKDVFLGPIGWLAVALSVVGQAATTAGLFMTSVAHVTVIYATAPFLAAAMAWLWLRESISRSALTAIVLSICGIAIVVSGTPAQAA